MATPSLRPQPEQRGVFVAGFVSLVAVSAVAGLVRGVLAALVGATLLSLTDDERAIPRLSATSRGALAGVAIGLGAFLAAKLFVPVRVASEVVVAWSAVMLTARIGALGFRSNAVRDQLLRVAQQSCLVGLGLAVALAATRSVRPATAILVAVPAGLVLFIVGGAWANWSAYQPRRMLRSCACGGVAAALALVAFTTERKSQAVVLGFVATLGAVAVISEARRGRVASSKVRILIGLAVFIAIGAGTTPLLVLIFAAIFLLDRHLYPPGRRPVARPRGNGGGQRPKPSDRVRSTPTSGSSRVSTKARRSP